MAATGAHPGALWYRFYRAVFIIPGNANVARIQQLAESYDFDWLLAALDDTEREFITRQFGVYTGVGESVASIRRDLRISSARTQEIRASAFRKMRAQADIVRSLFPQPEEA